MSIVNTLALEDLVLSANMRKQRIDTGPLKTAEDCCKSSSFSKIYHIQAVVAAALIRMNSMRHFQISVS